MAVQLAKCAVTRWPGADKAEIHEAMSAYQNSRARIWISVVAVPCSWPPPAVMPLAGVR